MKHLATILLILLSALSAHAGSQGARAPFSENPTVSNVKVRLYSANTIKQLNISIDLGHYNLYATDNGIDELLEDMIGDGRSIILRSEGKKVHVSVNETDYGTFKSVRLETADTACILCLNPANCKQRTYEGNLEISTLKNGNLLILNDVEFETYIAGVVQSEIYGNQTDIFRIQAIISRTWALRNMRKHAAEGYNFCDHVHCQAYLNRCIRPDIMLGAIESSGETLVDSTGALIETPFHSNSGGETANSEDVWRAALPYLRAVEDTFSYNMRQSDWTKIISRDRWLNYFSKTHKIDINDSTNLDTLLSFTQEHRKVNLLGVPLTCIRTDFQLKSTFFSVTVDSTTNDIILLGHGYGHGVGLSQEGAIRMVSLGISYDSILQHYYTGAILYRDPYANSGYVADYVKKISQIIEEDKNTKTQVHSKKNDWLGRLFRLRDREEREEIYIEEEQDNEKDWEYDW
jgi:stage II sporulation protein D